MKRLWVVDSIPAAAARAIALGAGSDASAHAVVQEWTIRGFLKLYRVDMSEAAETDPYRYGSFNEFFTRALKRGARPIARDAHAIASPADGCVSEAGSIEGDRLLQAKGRHYRLTELLAAQPWASRFEGGSFATIYLAPFNYHRVHMPLRGELKETVYVPGRLFSVNTVTAQHVPRLFARNERVLTLFDTAYGQAALVMVGALNVGSMATVWAGDITPAARRVITRVPAAPDHSGEGRRTRPIQHGLHRDSAVRAESRALASAAACGPRGAARRIAGPLT